MALEAEIDGVGAILDGGDQAGSIAGRRQQLGLDPSGGQSPVGRGSRRAVASRSARLIGLLLSESWGRFQWNRRSPSELDVNPLILAETTKVSMTFWNESNLTMVQTTDLTHSSNCDANVDAYDSALAVTSDGPEA